jgi:hypothetical protein
MKRMLRYWMLIAFGLLGVGAVPAAWGQELTSIPATSPSYSGDFPDPALVWDGSTHRYWAYATQHLYTNIQVMSSADLAGWSSVGDALPVLPAWAAWGRTWAPSVAKFGSRWVMWYTTQDASSGRQCLSVATGTGPGGPFTDTSGGPTICQLSNGGSIDANIFVTGAGAYLFWKSDDNALGHVTHLWASHLALNGLQITSTPVEVLHEDAAWQAPAMEGPSMILNGGWYYLFYGAGNWDSSSAAIGYATCTTPLGPCSDHTTITPWLRSYGTALGPSGPNVFTDAAGSTRLAYHAWDGCVGYPNCNRALWIGSLSFAGGRPQLNASPPSSFSMLPGAATDIAVGANGSPWLVGTNTVPGGHPIYHWTGSSWAAVSGGAVTIATGPDGTPWIINSAHQIYAG